MKQKNKEEILSFKKFQIRCAVSLLDSKIVLNSVSKLKAIKLNTNVSKQSL